MHRSVPTHDQILVPETLLKKRKSQEKAREERSAELEKKKKVCQFPIYSGGHRGWTFMMHNTIFATRHSVSMLSPINHLSGLIFVTNGPSCIHESLYHGLTWTSQAQKEKRGVIFKRAEQYVKEYRDTEREKIRLSRLAKQDGSYYIPAEDKLVFVVRIKG